MLCVKYQMYNSSTKIDISINKNTFTTADPFHWRLLSKRIELPRITWYSTWWITSSIKTPHVNCKCTLDMRRRILYKKWVSRAVTHDAVLKWKHFSCYWPFVRGIYRSPMNAPYKGQWRGDLILSLICVWINGWVNHHEAGDLRRYRAHYDVTVMNN